MIAIGIALYVVLGLIASRQVKFALENSVDRGNVRRQREWDDWYEIRTPDTPGHQGRQYTYWGMLSGWYIALPLLGGLLWPAMVIGLTIGAVSIFVWRVVHKPLGSGIRLFFENPARRKERRYVAVKP